MGLKHLHFLCLATLTSIASAQWTSVTSDNTTVSAETGDQSIPAACTDGAGGAFVTWRDFRNGNADIYLQRIDAQGNLVGMPGGQPICTQLTTQLFPAIVSDGVGGAFIAWATSGQGVWIQRVNEMGFPYGAANGTQLPSATPAQNVAIATDGAGGAIVTYETGSSSQDIHALRFNSLGQNVWLPATVVCSQAQDQILPQIAADGAGGAFITWSDRRNGTDYDTYAARITSAGSVSWTTPLSTATGDQMYCYVSPNAAAGLVATWTTNPFSMGDTYVQRLHANGTLVWPSYTNGFPLAATSPSEIGYGSVMSSNSSIITCHSWGGVSIRGYYANKWCHAR